MTVNLLGLSRSELISYCAELGEKPFRAKQLLHWIHQTGAADFSGMTDMSKAFRERLAGIAEITAPNVIRDTTAHDGTRKWLMNVGTGDRKSVV